MKQIYPGNGIWIFMVPSSTILGSPRNVICCHPAHSPGIHVVIVLEVKHCGRPGPKYLVFHTSEKKREASWVSKTLAESP